MTIRFPCTGCKRALKTDDRRAGTKVKCPQCGTTVRVPPATPQPAAAVIPPPVVVPRRAAAAEDEEEPVHFARRSDPDEGLDMTPMVDVTFLLLIFFMVTAAFNLQKSIEVPPPDQTESAAQRTYEEIQEDDDYVIVEIRSDNTVWVNDREAPSRQEVLSILREAREGPSGNASGGPSSLLVLADGDAWHETVIMALDAGNAVGMENVRLATFDEENL